METIKTFINNASKETPEECEPYPDLLSDSQKDTLEDAKSNLKAGTENVKQNLKSGKENVKSDLQSGKENVKSDLQSSKQNTKSNLQSSKTDLKSDVQSSKTESKGTSKAPVMEDTTTTSEAPVVHERVHKTIVDENQTVRDVEHHQDHYKKKIQPILQKEDDGVVDTAGETKFEAKSINKNDSAATDKKLAAEDAKLKSTSDTDVKHETVQKKDIVNEQDHHHLHERVQPVIERDVYQKEVKHNTKKVHETVQDGDAIEETEVLPPKAE